MAKKTMNNIVFLIPSLDPDDKMPKYVHELCKAGAKKIVIVDDGSKEENKKYFLEIQGLKEVTVLRHVVNQGKGRALKTGMNHILDSFDDIVGIVTADADGQHSADDTIACAKRLLDTKKVVFGTRNFNEDIVPFKSRNGNKITTFVFKLLYGKQVNDTQTGLRALPIDFVKDCLKLNGERFEYEIAMLIEIVNKKMEIIEEPIKTIYFESNRATHFNTFKDSFRIYKIMLGTFIKFSCSGLLSSLIDLCIYTLIISIISTNNSIINIFIATLIARVVSSLFNYQLNKNTVFESNSKNSYSLPRYYLLVLVQMLCSWIFVTLIFNKLHFNTTIIKVLVDFVLFCISYQVQKRIIFIEVK